MSSSQEKGEPLFEPGSTVDQFRVIRLAGRGGMGDVYLARDTRLGRRVALKVVRSAGKGSQTAIQRFLHEARTTARFNHPHIVTVYASGVHQGHPYLALEYLDGQNLRERMGGEGPSFRESLRTGLAISSALEEAHRHNVLHRDLKPENVLIPRDGRVRVVDFGLAEVVPGNDSIPPETLESLDRALTVLPTSFASDGPGIEGTPAYMAPEQWRNQEITAATDIWALGVIIYELLVGCRPYQANDLVRLAAKVVGPEPVPALQGVAGAEGELSGILSRCLQKDPQERPLASEVVEVLARLVDAHRPQQKSTEQSPFRGLQAFSEEHAASFFGRDEEVGSFLERLREETVLPVVGPSGAGKSSFVQAGVIPRLREQGPWMVLRVRPGSRPFANLAARIMDLSRVGGDKGLALQATVDLFGEEGGPSRPAEERRDTAPEDKDHHLAQKLRHAPQTLFLLLDSIANKLSSRVLLFVDQLEELYTLVGDEDLRRRFMQAVCTAANDPVEPIRVVLTVREDFLGRLSFRTGAGSPFRKITVISTPEPEALEQILNGPLKSRGYAFDDPTLAPEMIAAAGQEQASLPLLQFTAQMLWERRHKERRLLTRGSYAAIGELAGALASHADGVLSGLSAVEVGTARDILLRLVTPERTRRMLPWRTLLEGLPPGAEDMVRGLVEARLLSVRKSDHGGTGGAVVELVHESLATGWGKLSRWIEQGREDLLFLDEVGQQAEIWQKRGSRENEVWTGPALLEARQALRRCSAKVPTVVVRFLDVGQRKERQKLWRRRGLLSLGALLLTLVVLVLAFQKDQAQQRSQEARVRLAQALREGARAAVLQGDLLEARAKLRGSLETKDSLLGRALWRRLGTTPLAWRKVMGDDFYDVAFSPDGRTVAAACQDRTVYLLDVQSMNARALRGQKDQVLSVAFSPDSKRLAAGTWSGQVVVRDLTEGTMRILRGHTGAVQRLTFSPDSKSLASGSYDRTVRVWDMAGRDKPRVLSVPGGKVAGVAFSPDGKLLACGSNDRQVHIWELTSGRQVRALAGHGAGVMDVAFSPDGRLLASASFDRQIRLWDVASGQLRRVLRGHTREIMDVAFSPDGARLASAGYDRVIRLWDVANGRQEQILEGHTATVWSLAFSPDGKQLSSCGTDKSVCLWNLGRPVTRRPTQGHQGQVFGLAFSPDSATLASGGSDALVRLWDVKSGRQKRLLKGHTDRIRQVTFSQNGKLLASSSRDKTIRLWSLGGRAEPLVLAGHRAEVNGIRFNRDGSTLFSSSDDKTVRSWDVSSGALREVLVRFDKDINDVDLGPDNTSLAFASKNVVGLVRLSAPGDQPPRMIKGHGLTINAVRFSPDGRLLGSASSDGTVRVEDLIGKKSRVLRPSAGRAYGVAFHPGGDVVGVASSDGSASLISLKHGSRKVLQGHRSEVNSIVFSPDGRLAATSGDDGTVRVWEVNSGRPHWRAPVMLSSPVRLYTHQGWITPGDGNVVLKETGSKWLRAVQEKASRAGESADRGILCLSTFDGRLEIWDPRHDERLVDKPLLGQGKLVAFKDGCITLAKGEVHIHYGNGTERRIHSDAGAMDFTREKILVASGERAFQYDTQGKRQREFNPGVGVTAMLLTRKWLAVGFGDGNIELLPLKPGISKSSFSFEGVPSSPVIRLVRGPRDTIIAGFGNGQVGLWHLANGVRLYHSRLHGAVIHLRLDKRRLMAATEIGDHISVDLSALSEDYCTLLRRIWQEIPVTWGDGLLVKRPAPVDHACAPGQ